MRDYEVEFTAPHHTTTGIAEMPDILTATMISEHMHISRRRIYELFQLSSKHGGIPCFSVGASKRVLKRDYIAWIEEQKDRSARDGDK